MIDLVLQVFIEVRITYSSQHDQLPAVFLCLCHLSHLLFCQGQGETSLILCQRTLFYANFFLDPFQKEIDVDQVWFEYPDIVVTQIPFKCWCCSNSSECLTLMSTSEEMTQARQTSTHVTFNAPHLTS